MGVIKGLEHLRNMKASLYVGPCPEDARVMDYSTEDEKKFVIEINEKSSMEEQIISLIHEAIHFDEPFLKYLHKPNQIILIPLLWSIEKKIENLTEQVYFCQPNLVKYLRKSLENSSIAIKR